MSEFQVLVEETQQGKYFYDPEEYKTRKAAEREAVHEMRELSADHALSGSGNLHQYLALQSRFFQYSAGNALLILIQHPDATDLRSFDEWKKANHILHKDESGVKIMMPNKYDTLVNGQVETRNGFNVGYLYDVSQTRYESYTPAQVPYPPEDALLKAVIKASPIRIAVDNSIDAESIALYDPASRRILCRDDGDTGATSHALLFAAAMAQTHDAGLSATPELQRFIAGCAAYMTAGQFGLPADAHAIPLPSDKSFAGAEVPDRLALLNKGKAMAEIMTGKVKTTLYMQQQPEQGR